MKKGILKSLAAAFLCCTMLFTGCNSDGDVAYVTDEYGDTVTDESGNPVPETEPEETTVTEDENAPLAVKVGFVYGEEVDNSTQIPLYENARQQLERSLGIETCYIENALVGDFTEAVNALKEDGCNVIVSCGNKFNNSIKKESTADETDTWYISLGGSDTTPKMASFQSRMYQMSNIAGIVAAYNSDSNILGIVGDTNVYACYPIIDAYILGAKEITENHTDVRLNWAWSNSESETKEAIDDLVAQGCDVIMICQTSDYGIRYCEELGVKVIGSAYNMPELAPTTYLTGFFYNYSTYLVDMVRSIQYSSFNPVCFTDGISSGTIRLTELSSICKEGTDEIAKTLYDIVESGNSKIFTNEIRDIDNNIRIQKGEVFNHTQIMNIDWLEESVSAINDFTQPIMNPVSSDFIVHY